jgi:hypothetical protein
MQNLDFDNEGIVSAFVSIENILKGDMDEQDIANYILESTFQDYDILKKDTVDRFIDFIYFKVKTGYPYIINLAYPTKRITDEILEKKIIKILNYYLLPDIIFRILKFMTRNIQKSDTNLFLAQLIINEEIIHPIFDTFKLFRNDILTENRQKKTLMVKSIQQLPSQTETKFSSPLDAACRLKYVLEYISLKQDVSHIYTEKDLKLYAKHH